MAKKQKYRQDICPYCTTYALQRLLFAHNELPDPFVDRGEIILQTRLETYSLFRCEQCKAMLFYKTTCDDVDWGPEEVNEKSPQLITELDEDEFNKTSYLLYPTGPFNQVEQESEGTLPSLAPSVPKPVREICDEYVYVLPEKLIKE